MRTLNELLTRKKDVIKSSIITQEERDLIKKEISRQYAIEPKIDHTPEAIRANTKWYHNLNDLQRALDLH